MNTAAILIVLLGVALVVMGSRNTYKQVLQNLFNIPTDEPVAPGETTDPGTTQTPITGGTPGGTPGGTSGTKQ